MFNLFSLTWFMKVCCWKGFRECML